MRKEPDGTLVYSPSDLVTYLRSPYAAWMERLRIERPGSVEPDEETQDERLIKEMGVAHEHAWLSSCRAAGEVVDLEPFSRANVARFTLSSDGSLAPVAN